jgi:putative ABC transport system permease protein
VCASVFLALSGPALSQELRTHAMNQQLAAQGGALRGDLQATAANWNQFSTDWGEPSPVPLGSFEKAARNVSIALSQAVPLAPGAWAGLTTSLFNAPAGFAGLQYPTRLEVTYRTSLTAYTRLVAGTYSDSGVPPHDVGVVITTQTAARFRLHVGSIVTVSSSYGLAPALDVTGVVSADRPASAFWTTDVLPIAPVFQPPMPHGPPPNWQGAALADPGQLVAMQTAFCPQPNGTACSTMQVHWEIPFDLNAFDADQAQALLNDLNTATSGTTLSSTLPTASADVTISAPVTTALAAFINTQATIMTILLLLFVSLLAIGLAVIALAARLMVGRREDELRMLRARGATMSQLARRVFAGTAIAAVPAVAAGTLLALIPIRLVHASLDTGWRFAVFVAAVALAGPPLFAGWRHRRPEPSAVNPAVILTAETRAARFSMAARRRIVAGVTLCGGAVAVLLLLDNEGLPAPGSVNWVLTVAPVLVALPAALLAMRIYPLIVGLLLRVWHRATATGYVALASSVRVPATLSAYTIVLALTLAAFCGMVSGGISRGQVAASWQTTGADAVVAGPNLDFLTPAALRQIRAVPGARQVAEATSTTWSLPNGSQLTLIQVDPAQYAALTADTPFPPVPVAELGMTGSTYSVVADPATAALLGGRTGTLKGLQGYQQVKIRVDGTVTSSPAAPGGGQFAIAVTHPLPGAGPADTSYQILIAGNVDQAALDSVVSSALPQATVAFHASTLASLTDAPLIHAAALLMTMTVVACSLFAVVSLLFGLALGARERQATLARLAVMGYQRDTRFVLVNALPALLAAAAAAIACTLTLPTLVGSALNLSVFTGSSAPVQFRPDLMALCLPGAAILVLAVLALTLQTRRPRHGATGMLRAGS